MTSPGLISCNTSGPQAPTLERAGPEGLDEHVRFLHQVLEQLRTLGLPEVDGCQSLVAIDEGPPQRHAILLPTQRPQGIPLGMLDLDDVSAEVTQERPDDGPSEEHGRIDDLESGQRPIRALVGSFHTASLAGEQSIVNRPDPNRLRVPQTGLADDAVSGRHGLGRTVDAGVCGTVRAVAMGGTILCHATSRRLSSASRAKRSINNPRATAQQEGAG